MTYYQMGRSKIPYLADVGGLAWNPFGCGCSGGCDGCWARLKVAPRLACPKCRAFIPHCHPERLDAPIRRNKPAVIGVQFTGDILDPAHDRSYFNDVLATMKHADWHTYVVLTQRAERLLRLSPEFPASLRQADNVWWGTTVRTEDEAERNVPPMLAAGLKHVWVSYEPAHGPVDFSKCLGSVHADQIEASLKREDVPGFVMGDALYPPSETTPWYDGISGIIIGCDNRRDVPFKLEWAEQVVDDCQAAGVSVYVKQIRLTDGGPMLTDPADFPPHLRVRDLPCRQPA